LRHGQLTGKSSSETGAAGESVIATSNFARQQAGRDDSSAVMAWPKAQQQNGFPTSSINSKAMSPRTIFLLLLSTGLQFRSI
jgi:hypothetical protein